ncbi:hypothetical protein pb186bvf_006606 [Paramecium bursaria]
MDIEEYGMVQEDVVIAIANVLDEVVQETDFLESQLNTRFHTLKKPSITLKQYISRIQKYSYCSYECYILALIYIDRIQDMNQELVINSYCIHRFLLIAILIGIKYNDDDYYKNEYYAKVGGISLQELNLLELEFLTLIDHRLYVSDNVYFHYKDRLTKYSMM